MFQKEKLARPVNRYEYIYDVLNELIKQKNEFYFIFKRILWFYELKLNTDIYIDMMYTQQLPDYLQGLIIRTNMDMLTDSQNVIDFQIKIYVSLHPIWNCFVF